MFFNSEIPADMTALIKNGKIIQPQCYKLGQKPFIPIRFLTFEHYYKYGNLKIRIYMNEIATPQEFSDICPFSDAQFKEK